MAGMADGGVGAADLLGDARVRLREALDVRLVDDGVVVGAVRGAVVAPVEGGVGHHGQHRVAEAVHGVVRCVVVVEAVAEQGLVAVDLAVDRLGVRVKQQLGRIAPVPLIGVVGPVDPEAVALAGTDSRQVAVPHEPVQLGQVDALLRSVVRDQRQLDPLRRLREEREVGAGTVIGGSQRIRPARLDPHRASLRRNRGRALPRYPGIRRSRAGRPYAAAPRRGRRGAARLGESLARCWRVVRSVSAARSSLNWP